jgi:hypothetical protein
MLFYGHSNAQLVNIESKRMKVSGSNSYRLNGNINFSYSNNNGTYFSNIGTGLTTAFRLKDPSTIYFFTGSYNLAKSKLQDFQNSWFFHLRYNKKLGNVKKEKFGLFRLEAFLQNQNNELQTINSRNLIGVGIRYKFIDYPQKRKDSFRLFHGYGIIKQVESTSNKDFKEFKLNSLKAYFGNSYMYEIEKVNSSQQKFYNHRNSSYLSVSLDFTKLELVNTIYFQPLYTDFSNYRILEQFQLGIPFSNTIGFNITFNYFINSFSPTQDEDYSSYVNFGLSFNK